MLAVGRGMDFCSLKRSQIKVACTPSSKDKTDLPLIAHTVEQAKAMYVLGSRISLAVPPLPDGRFIKLSVVSSHVFDHVPCAIRPRERIPTDTACINQMRLL